MNFNATVRDLANLDLCYAPPFGSAKDPVHQAAFAAGNHLDGIAHVAPADVELSDVQLVDVRTTSEIENHPLAGGEHAIHIPVDELRHRLGELDPSLETIVSCGVGVRGHVAVRILKQHGFNSIKNLSGGRHREKSSGSNRSVAIVDSFHAASEASWSVKDVPVRCRTRREQSNPHFVGRFTPGDDVDENLRCPVSTEHTPPPVDQRAPDAVSTSHVVRRCRSKD